MRTGLIYPSLSMYRLNCNGEAQRRCKSVSCDGLIVDFLLDANKLDNVPMQMHGRLLALQGRQTAQYIRQQF